MPICKTCKFYHICKGRLNETVSECVRYKSVEQTNEEWRKTCSAEEFAEFISDVIYDCADRLGNQEDEQRCLNCPFRWCSKQDVLKWLKEKHEA